MTENKEIKKGKKTLSLKLGSKPIISNKRGIEAGKTVIVEKKRYKRNTNTDQKFEQASLNKKEVTDTSNVAQNIITDKKSRSGVILKPLTKDEQKKILQADSKEEKYDAIDKIRKGNSAEESTNEKSTKIEGNSEPSIELKEDKKDTEKKKAIQDKETDFQEKKKPSSTFGRKKTQREKSNYCHCLE